MIEGWLAGKLSGLIIFAVACLAPFLLVGLIHEALALHGITIPIPFFGHVELVHGAIADRDAAYRARDKALVELGKARSDLAQAHANEGKLTDGLHTCNASVTALGAQGAALQAGAQRRVDALLAQNAALRDRMAAVAAIVPTGAICPSVDHVFDTGFGP